MYLEKYNKLDLIAQDQKNVTFVFGQFLTAGGKYSFMEG